MKKYLYVFFLVGFIGTFLAASAYAQGREWGGKLL